MGLLPRQARVQRSGRMSPPERVVEGGRLALTRLLKQECALTCGAASDYVVGLRLALLKAAKDAGDTAATPGGLKAEARGAVRPLLERLALEGTEAFLSNTPGAQARQLIAVFSSLLTGTITRARYRAVVEDAQGLEQMLAAD